MIGDFTPWGSRLKPSLGWIEDANGCHIWTGCRNNGYGRARDKNSGLWRSVHCMRYEQEIGPIPPGLQLDHFACDNRGCCNPHHCRPVTQRENMLRGCGWAAINRAKTHCKRGHLLSGENLLTHALKKGSRGCRKCYNDYCRHRKLLRSQRLSL